MRYCQLDKISEIEPGKRLVATRTLRAEEEYLKDHFPRFPVMPGVMMLEALHQAAVWMVRTGEDFASPLVVLHEVKSVKFGDFLAPGETLVITADLVKEESPYVTVKTKARKNGKMTVSARVVLEKCVSKHPPRLKTDDDLRTSARKQFNDLFGEIMAPVSG